MSPALTMALVAVALAAIVGVLGFALWVDAKSADAEPKPKGDHPDMWFDGGAL